MLPPYTQPCPGQGSLPGTGQSLWTVLVEEVPFLAPLPPLFLFLLLPYSAPVLSPLP
jgi:hypothetical protein